MGYLDSFNPHGVPPREKRGYRIYPDGQYKVVVSAIEEKQSEYGVYLHIKMTFIDGEFRDETVSDFLEVGAQDDDRRFNAESALAELYRALGFDNGAKAADLVNRPLMIDLGHYTKKKTKEVKQAVRAYFPVERPAAPPANAAPRPAASRPAYTSPARHPKDENDTVPF